MAKLIYNIGLNSYYFGIRVASIFNHKAKLWIEGRKNWREHLKAQSKKLLSDRKTVWFHVSSLGEFEQGRPVMEALKKNKDINLVLSFFSPSGYEVMKDWPLADVICYLPEDNAKNATDFLSMLKPDLVVFVKYDLWFHFLKALEKRSIKSVLISSRFYPGQVYFKKMGTWYKGLLFLLDEILVQDQVSYDLLKSIYYQNVKITGDTRFDRVLELSKHQDRFSEIEKFIDGKKVFIAGSTWPLDERVMVDYLINNKQDIKSIIAPHDVSEDHVRSLKESLNGNAILYSEIQHLHNEKVLIVDTIGMLSRLYTYGDISYVGGAFKEGLHNILEPAAFALPVITGIDHSGFTEGPAMQAEGALFKVNNREEFSVIMNKLLENQAFYNESSTAARSFIEKNRGASEKTIKILEGYLS